MNKPKIDVSKLRSILFIFFTILLLLSGCGRHKPERIMQDAQAAFQQRDFVTAMIKLEDFLQRYPNDPRAAEAQYAHAMSNMGLGRFDKAIEEYQLVVKKYPASSEWVMRAELDIASAYIELGKFPEAIAQYDKILTTYSRETDLVAMVRFNRARAMEQQKNWTAAIQGYTEVTKSAAPERMRADAYFQIANIYRQTKRFPQAIATYKAIQTEFANREQVLFTAYWFMGETYKEAKQFPAAIETYKSITAKFVKLPRIQRAELESKIADCYKQQKKFKEAIAIYQSVQKQYMNDAMAQDFALWANVELGSIYKNELKDMKSAQGYYDTAVKAYTEMMKNPPMGDVGKSAYAAVKLGEIYEYHLGDKAKALETYKFAVQKYPKAQWSQFAYIGVQRLTQNTAKQPVTTDTTTPKKK
ncbi:MAG: tetratricopeptide repeat protein [bacterium]|nr:tetratricopeptide repeat protein [bacterium]